MRLECLKLIARSFQDPAVSAAPSMRRPLEAHLCDAILSNVEDPSPQVREVSLCGHCVKHCPLAGALATARTQRSLESATPHPTSRYNLPHRRHFLRRQPSYVSWDPPLCCRGYTPSASTPNARSGWCSSRRLPRRDRTHRHTRRHFIHVTFFSMKVRMSSFLEAATTMMSSDLSW